MAVVITVQGPSGSGKTTLIERVIPRLQARGLKVGAVKHAHEGFTVDPEGKDSCRMWQAGAQAVLVAAPQELFVRQRCTWSRVSELLGLLPQELDCVFIEGFVHTTTAMDVPVSVRIELTGGGARLNGQLIPRNEVAAAVEELVARQLGGGQVATGSSEERHEHP